MTSTTLRVAVVGAGMGGLVLGIALRRFGVHVELFEQAPELGEVGAAVALSANSTRLLRRLGVDEALAPTAAEPTELQFRRWDTGELIVAHPMGEHYRQRCGAPYYGIHRADLQSALVNKLGPDAVRLNHKVTDVSEETDGMRLTFEGGDSAFADVVVGADGIHSALRRQVTGSENRAVFSGDIGFRGMIPLEKLSSLPDPDAIQFWAGPGAHLLHYAMEGGKLVNFLAVTECPEWLYESWRAPGDVQEAVEAFEGWHPAVTEMIGAVEGEATWWALHDYAPLQSWTSGRVVLLGDAAHAMLPHQGQGANQAIEDAVALAHFLDVVQQEDDLQRALQLYEALRRPRTRRVQRYSRLAARDLHLPDGPKARQRDARLAKVAEDIAWIHEYDIEEDLAKTNADSDAVSSEDEARVVAPVLAKADIYDNYREGGSR